MLILVLTSMAIVVFALLLLPLLRRGGLVPPRAQFDRAVYREQLAEVDRDLARGLLGFEEARAARIQIERRLLNTATDTQAPVSRGVPRKSWALAVVVLLLGAGGSSAMYLRLGSPGQASGIAGATVQNASAITTDAHANIDEEIAGLRERLKADPTNADGWALYGRTLGATGRFEESAAAFAKVLELQPKRTDIAGVYAEMLVLSAKGMVTPQAHAQLDIAVARDRHDNVSRYYLALAQAQAGDDKGAIASWLAVAADEPADSEIRTQIEHHIAESARFAKLPVSPMPPMPQSRPSDAEPGAGPNAADIAAADQMTPAQRQDLVKTMVAQLATKLDANPNDAKGWMQLGRSYRILGEADKSAAAYDRAAALLPNDSSVPLQELDAIVTALGPTETLPPRGVVLLTRVKLVGPQKPDTLWLLGTASARAKQNADAKRYWDLLLAQLPPDSEDGKSVKAALDMLQQSNAVKP